MHSYTVEIQRKKTQEGMKESAFNCGGTAMLCTKSENKANKNCVEYSESEFLRFCFRRQKSNCNIPNLEIDSGEEDFRSTPDLDEG